MKSFWCLIALIVAAFVLHGVPSAAAQDDDDAQALVDILGALAGAADDDSDSSDDDGVSSALDTLSRMSGASDNSSSSQSSVSSSSQTNGGTCSPLSESGQSCVTLTGQDDEIDKWGSGNRYYYLHFRNVCSRYIRISAETVGGGTETGVVNAGSTRDLKCINFANGHTPSCNGFSSWKVVDAGCGN